MDLAKPAPIPESDSTEQPGDLAAFPNGQILTTWSTNGAELSLEKPDHGFTPSWLVRGRLTLPASFGPA